MYIGLKNIQSLFAAHASLLAHSDGTHCLTGWTKFASAPFPLSDHLLYTCTYSDDMDFSSFTGNIHILCIVDEGLDLTAISAKFPDTLSLLLIECQTPETVYTELQHYFHVQCGVSMFGATLLESLAFDDGLQSAVEYSFRIFQNPVFVFDMNYNLIAATWDAIKELNIQDQVVVNKRFSDQEFRMINRQDHIHSRVRKSEFPIRAYNEELGYEQLYCAINTKKDLGHIVISAINKPFEPIDTELLLIFKKYMNEQMKKDAFIRTSRGFNYEYFLRDLLDKKLATDLEHLPRFQSMDDEFSGNMYCMVIETARSAATINSVHIRNMVESRIPNTKTLIYEGQIIAIFSILANQLIPKEYLIEIRKICNENGLYAGLSNCFQDIMKFQKYYTQALRAIELGISERNEPDLFWYRDYYLEHVKNIFTQKESPEIFCHPKMKFLLDYDRQHHSKLAYTLYMYLIHERNLAATADAMSMHRTSLVYRFKKIHSLLGDDFDDYNERMYMILSYEMIRAASEKK